MTETELYRFMKMGSLATPDIENLAVIEAI
jgi:hypothetical protein